MRTRAPRLASLAALLLATWAMTALGQTNYPAEIKQTAALLQENPASQTNRVRLATLYYLQGSGQASGGSHTGAIESFRNGLATLQTQGNTIPRSNTAYQALWYSLGYSYRTTGQYERSAATLAELASAFPKYYKGRYLLGLTLLETGKHSDALKGIDTLRKLAEEDSGGDGAAARRAGARWALNYGIILAGEGKPGEAANLMLQFNRSGQAEGAADADEKAAMLYGAGYFKQAAGRYSEAIADFEALRSLNSDFILANGITLPVILTNAYYAGGLQLLSSDSMEALQKAVQYFNSAEKIGNPKAADVNYGKAVAYLKMGRGHENDVTRELEAVGQKDPNLYAQVNQAR